ncbi:MAG: SNF2-related protein, partial [Verrucomicrobiales bacterium]
MSDPISRAEIADWLRRGEWRNRFDAGGLTRGLKLARARKLRQAGAEILDTGDAELSATALDADGSIWKPVVAIWREDAGVNFDASCCCPVSAHCEHAAALLEHLAKGDGVRLETAFGGTPHAEVMTRGKRPDPGHGHEDTQKPESAPNPADDAAPRFLLRLERRPGDRDRLAWLPERYAQAFAIYGDQRVPLSPAGQLPPIQTPEKTITRDRARETEALNTLYALNFLPGAEQPPSSLRKLERPLLEKNGTLWAVDRKEWPHPEFFWQRFRHEGVPALERRGWEVRFAPDFGLNPLVFKTDAWRAEIVKEGHGWFHLSAGFDIDGEAFELQPILAALVANRFLELTQGLPDGQEFMIFLPDGRALALPVGRFRNILETLGELMEFKFPPGGSLKLGALDAALMLGSGVLASTQDDAQPGLAVEAPAELEALAERLRNFERIERVPLPKNLVATLRDYQLDGFRWMQFLARFGLNGILADDMGLGKTLQTLAHLLAQKESGRNQGQPSLVIAPTSVVENWQRESAKFAPELKILIL